MAGDWIKVRPCLRKEPEVRLIAAALGLSTRHVVGALIDLWGLADVHAVPREAGQMSQLERDKCPKKSGTNVPSDPGTDGLREGFLATYTADEVDNETGTPGLAVALQSVGWLRIYPDGVAIPGFDAHNGSSAKQRACDAKRKSGQRLSQENRDKCPKKSGTNVPEEVGQMSQKIRHREEKRREEDKDLIGVPIKSSAPAVPPSLDCVEFRAAWDDWIAYRQALPPKLKPQSIQKQLDRLAKYGPAAAVEAILSSMANGYRGLFPERHAQPEAKPRRSFDRLQAALEATMDEGAGT